MCLLKSGTKINTQKISPGLRKKIAVYYLPKQLEIFNAVEKISECYKVFRDHDVLINRKNFRFNWVNGTRRSFSDLSKINLQVSVGLISISMESALKSRCPGGINPTSKGSSFENLSSR